MRHRLLAMLFVLLCFVKIFCSCQICYPFSTPGKECLSDNHIAPQRCACRPTCFPWTAAAQNPAAYIIRLLNEVPTLQRYLGTDSLRPLSATCRMTRSWFNQHVRVIKVQDHRGIDTVSKAKWPNLIEIRHPALYLHKLIQEVSAFSDVLGDTSFYALGSTCSLLHNATREAIKIIGVPGEDHLQWLHVQKYPRLRLVIVVGGERVAQKLSKGGFWSLLLSLEVENCGCIAFFSPRQTQELSNEDYQYCADQLSTFLCSRSRHAQIINVLAIHAGVGSLKALAMRMLPYLSTLTAFACGLNPQDMFDLSEGNWNSLTRVDFSGSHFDAAAISYLATAYWPDLTFVSLINCGLDDAAIAELSLSDWPKLQSLYLGKNNISPAAVALLVEGGWPCLETLDLEEITLAGSAMQCLCTGKWPLLNCLTLSLPHGGLIGLIVTLLRRAYPNFKTMYCTTGPDTRCTQVYKAL